MCGVAGFIDFNKKSDYNTINEKKISKDIFNVDEVLELKKRFFLNKESEKKIWLILIFQMWFERWM